MKMNQPYVNIYIPRAQDRRRIRRAAKLLGKSASAFIREASIAAAAAVEEKKPQPSKQ